MLADWKRAREFFKRERKNRESLSSFLINFFFPHQFRAIESFEFSKIELKKLSNFFFYLFILGNIYFLLSFFDNEF